MRGSGVWLYDREGRAYLDVYNNVPHVGHTHPAVVRAIQQQTAILATHTRYLHAGILEYAERLTATLPAALERLHLRELGQRGERRGLAHRAVRRPATRARWSCSNAYHGITRCRGGAHAEHRAAA